MPTATRYIRSKDDSVQIAVEMTDALHQLVWGRLCLSTEPHDCPTITVADPVAWVREQRVLREVPTKVRLAGMRAKWAALAPALAEAA
jgi:hypothetical protein